MRPQTGHTVPFRAYPTLPSDCGGALLGDGGRTRGSDASEPQPGLTDDRPFSNSKEKFRLTRLQASLIIIIIR